MFVLAIMALVACTSQQAQRTPSARERKSSEAEALEIIGVVWRLMEIQKLETKIVGVDDPNKYTLELLPDGNVRIRADCNRGFGTYRMTGREISFNKTAYTRAACPPGSLFDVYTQTLEQANSYVVEGGNLYITYGTDGGILKFAKP